MPEPIARAVAFALVAYVVAGIPFAILFAASGVNRVDPVARRSPWGFRIMIVPGVVALWPLLMFRWVRGAGVPEPRDRHRDAARPARTDRR